MSQNVPVKLSDEVSQALKHNKPVVALESAMLSGGTRFPHNFHEVNKVLEAVRSNGAVPAMIAILDGAACIGLSTEELRELASADAPRKTDCKDIAHVIMKKEIGLTSVSAAVFLANLAKIPIVVTGAIAEIPSDLTAMGRASSTTVVCTGADSVENTHKMLDYLKSQGIYAAAFKKSEFPVPAFEGTHTSCMAPNCLGSDDECARLIKAHGALQLTTGNLIAVTVPTKRQSALYDSAKKTAKVEALGFLDKSESFKEKFAIDKAKRVANLRLMSIPAEAGAKIAVALSKLQNAGT